MDPEPVESFLVTQILRGLTAVAVSGWFFVNLAQHRPTHIPKGVNQPVVGSTAEVKFATDTARIDVRHSSSRQPLSDVDNHATVEFLEDGRLADSCPTTRIDGRPCQLHHAIKFLGNAYAQALKEDAQLEILNVLVYIHGNENWASEYADNYPHFRQTINCLNLGTDEYQTRYGSEIGKTPAWKAPGTSEVLNCYNLAPGTATNFDQPYDKNDLRSIQKPSHQKFVGVFLGWRGNVTDSVMNVREKTARKIATSDVSQVISALYMLRDAAKADHPQKVRFIIIGHSFGGLIVEQSMIRIYQEAYQRNKDEVYMSCETSPTQQGIRPFADQVVTIAAAEHAVEAQKLLNNFTSHGQFCGSSKLNPSMSRPLFVAFVAKKDFWSYSFGSGLRHLVGGERDKAAPFENVGDTKPDVPSDSNMNWSTPAVVTYLQNVCYLQRPFKAVLRNGKNNSSLEGEAACDAERNAMSDENAAKVFKSTTLSNESPLSNLYVRFNCRLASSNDDKDTRPLCSTESPWDSGSTVRAWNRTPYWIGAIDIDVFGGHGPFGYPRFNQLLVDLAGAFDPLLAGQMLPAPGLNKFPGIAPYVPETRTVDH